MTGADLTIIVDGPVDGTLVQMLEIEGLSGEDFSLRAAFKRDASYIYLNEVSFDLAGNHLELSGQLGNWPELEGTKLVFSLDGPDLGIWSPILRIKDLPASAFTLNGGISATAQGLGLDNRVRTRKV